MIVCSANAGRAGLLLLVLLFPRAFPAQTAAADPPPGDIDRAFVRMYNNDFGAAFGFLDRYVASQPADPLGYALRSCAYLFSELIRLEILESEFFADDKRIIEKKKLKPDPTVKVKLFQAIDAAQSRATKVMVTNADDQNALFAMAITQGILLDYTALVEKRQLYSLSAARRANGYAQRLVHLNPKFYDAYLTTGLSEYLIGSLPFYVRWFVHFDGVKGSKDQGIDELQLVARSGRYLRPFARILLAIAYLREKKLDETQRLLAQLAEEYPENPLIRKELAKVSSRLRNGQGSNGR